MENVRVAGDGLLADVRAVPRKFAELVKAGAYTGRSVELSRMTSQRTGKKYDRVVSALAWLGDKLPAVNALEDVRALYQGSGELVRAYQLDTRAEGEALVAAAVAYHVITEAQRETTLRLYESAPQETVELLNSMGLAEIRALESWFHGADPIESTWSDEDERAYQAWIGGMR